MTRPLVAVILVLLLAFSYASSSGPTARTSLKRKISEIKVENDPSHSTSGQTSASSTPISHSEVAVVDHSASTSTWIIGDRFDLHPPSLPQSTHNLEAYRALFRAMGRRDFETTCLILSVFPDLSMTRYFKELRKGCHMNYYQLALITFTLEEFTTIVSFGHESDLIIPYGRGSSTLDLAYGINDASKIAHLRPIFAADIQRARQLKQRVKTHGLISLFTNVSK